jgi:SP family myo-inositol transporter-like MFS transporter 13
MTQKKLNQAFLLLQILVIVSSLIFIAGALIMALAKSFGVLLLGRIVVGLAVGIASMIVPIYVSK